MLYFYRYSSLAFQNFNVIFSFYNNELFECDQFSLDRPEKGKPSLQRSFDIHYLVFLS